jgi:alpha-tubulin suppressor-like RCC1 family protein
MGRSLGWFVFARRFAVCRSVGLVLSAFLGFSAMAALSAASAVAQSPLVAGAAAVPGPVMAWGYGGNGDLGNGTYSNSLVPVAGPANINFAAVSHGNNFGVGIDDSESLWAWGNNHDGQFGNGTLTGSDTPTPVTNWISNNPPVAAAAGNDFAVAADSGGLAWSWGLNTNGQLGDGTSTGPQTCGGSACSESPVGVDTGASTPLTNVVAVSTGGSHALALSSAGGNVWAWGNNNNYQLGDGSTSQPQSTYAVQVDTAASTPLNNVVAIAAGGSTSLALRSDGTVWAWGNNAHGQLGNGTTTNSQWAIQVSSLSNIVAIAEGSGFSLAVSATGTVYSWGQNSNGQLGNNSTTDSHTPVTVSSLSSQDIVSVSAGSSSSMAMNAVGQVWDWGLNSTGQLGNGSTTDSHVPVQVISVGDGAAAIEAGGSTSFIIGQPSASASPAAVNFTPVAVGATSAAQSVTVTNNGAAPLDIAAVRLGGANADSFSISGDDCSNQELAVGSSCAVAVRSKPIAAGGTSGSLEIIANTTAVYTYVPLAGSGLPVPATGLAFSTSPAQAFATGTTPNGGGAIGANTTNTAVGVSPASRSFVALSSGYQHALGLSADGTVWAWGQNGDGQIGNGSTTRAWPEVQVPTPGSMLAVSAGQYHSLALGADGTVWSWGLNSSGQLGDGTTTNRTTPVEVSGLNNVVAIAAGATHSLALADDGTVWAWGSNSSGQLGNGNTTNSDTPVQVSGLSGIVAIAAGGSHSLALSSSGTVYAWGLNSSGQLGNGNNTNSSVPVTVSSISTATAIAAGGAHSLALLSGGTVKSWGLNSSGQLGNGTTTNSNTPVSVSAISGIKQIAGGASHGVALDNTGKVWAWGLNSSGQLGNGNTTNQTSPVQMTSLGNGGGALANGNAGNQSLVIGQPYASLSATLLSFTAEPVGTPAPSLTETVTNTGSVPLQISQDTITGQDGDEFTITGDGCANTTIAPAGTCVIGVRYDPNVSGTPAAILRIQSNSPTSPSLITLDPPAAGGRPHRPSKPNVICTIQTIKARVIAVTCNTTPALRRTSEPITIRLLSGKHTLASKERRIDSRPTTTLMRLPEPRCTRTYTIRVSSAGHLISTNRLARTRASHCR